MKTVILLLLSVAAAFAQGNAVLIPYGGTTPSGPCPVIALATTTNSGGQLYYCNPQTGNWTLAAGSTSPGSVTSVAETFTGGLISVAGSPITTSGTFALTVAGTSGGVPYFSGAATWASSAALTLNGPVIGGGAGAAPTVVTPVNSAVLVTNGSGVPSESTTLPNGVSATSQPSSDVSTLIATDAFVKGLIGSLNLAVSVQATTVTVLPSSPTYNNGTAGVGATLTGGSNGALAAIDGYTASVGDRLLINNQADSKQNGVYSLTTLGNGGTPYVLTRATDFNTAAQINTSGAIPVLNGTVNNNTIWVLNQTIAAIGTGQNNINYSLGATTPFPVLTITNATSTGTTLQKLVKLTGAPSTAVINNTADTTGAIGICVANCGTSGAASVQESGIAGCVFDGATTAGDFVQISSTVNGDCHDAGATFPASGEVVGRVLTTNAAGGTFSTLLYSPDVGALAVLKNSANTTTSAFTLDSTAAAAGSVKVATAAVGNNTTAAASTAFVQTAVTASNPAVAVQAATTLASDTSGLTYTHVAGIGDFFTGSTNTAIAVDGFTFTALNQRLLVKDDTQSPSGAFNGIYYVTQLQTGILPPILTRALDYDQPSDINNTGAIPVVNGTANANTSWLLTSSVNTVGTDPLTYVQFSYAPSNIVTSATAATAAKQVCVASGSSKTCTYIDFPDAKIIPAANCVAGTAGGGWSYATSTFTAACRAGSNNLGGALQAIPSTGAAAQFLFELPADWDTATQPYISIFYGSGANTSGTVIWTVSSACSKEDGSVTDDPAFNAESAFGSQTMANANRMWAKSGQFTAITSGNNCIAGSSVIIKVAVSGTAGSNINAYQAVVTVPRLLTVQAE